MATPSDLIEDKNVSTPFNIGRAIELTGFQLHEAMPLAQGLVGKTSNPQAILREVLAWTGGQPFLTQKVCKLVLSAEESIPAGGEAAWVENLIRARIIENWETTDEPEHLRTIRDRILWSDRSSQLLQLYYQILQTGEVKANDLPEQMELRLSGLVVKQQGKLRVYNRIYQSIFHQNWVENALDEAGLLLQAVEKSPPSQAEIQSLEQAAVDALQQFESQQIEALLLALQAGQALKIRVEGGSLRLAPNSINLLSWLQPALTVLGEDDCPLQDYPTITPIYALQTILDNIQERNRLIAYQGGVTNLCFSPDGKHLATAGTDGTVQLWDMSRNQMVQQLRHQGTIYTVSFSPDGKRIATAGAGSTLQVWNLSGHQLAQWKSYQCGVMSASFSPDGQCLVTAGWDGTIRLWDLSLFGQELAQWTCHQGRILSISVSPDGEQIATTGEDRTARLWNLSGQEVAQLKGHQGRVLSLSFSPDGKRIATAGGDGIARLWNLSGQELAQLKGHQGSVLNLSFSPDGKRIATGGEDATVRLWNLTGQELAQLKGHRLGVTSVSFSQDGKRLATAGWDDSIRLWDLSEKHLAQWHACQGVVWSASFSPDGQRIVTVGKSSIVKLWDLSGQLLAQWQTYHGWLTILSFNPDGQSIVTTGEDGLARLWNLSGQQLAEWDAYQGRLLDVSFSPDGQCLVLIGENRTARLWNLSGQQLAQFYGHQGQVRISFSPTGQQIATAGGEGTVQLWNFSGQQLAQFNTYQDPVRSVKFSPDGQLLATAGGVSTVQLWDLSGQQLAQWNTAQEKILALSFSPDGQRLATAGWDGTVRVGDLSGRRIAQWKGHQGEITSMSFSPNGQCLATTGEDGMVRLWRIEGLDKLLSRGYDWLKDYFVTHPKALEKLEVCQNRFKSIEADKNLARAGDAEGTSGKIIPEGISQSQTTPEVPPALDCASKAEVRQLTAKTWVAVIGEMLARQGDIEKAVAAYTEAQTLDPTIDIPATVGNNLCWWGSLWGSAADVMDAGETAVALEPENGMFRDSRGLARALTGNIAGAIEDFQAFVDWTDNEQKRLQRQRWLAALRASENPFTQEEIERLLNEYNVAHSQVPAPTTVARRRLVTTASNESGEGFLGEFLVHDKLVRIYQGDITNLAVDVIVSSDDTYLNLSGGVSWRIRHVGGNEIYRETRNFIPCYLGDIAITTAGKLQAKRIFHGVVIDWLNDILPLKNVIQQVVHICLEIANKNRFESIAFPLLATGAGRLPVKVAWDTTLRQIIRDLSNENQKVVEVIIVVYGRKIVEDLKVKNYLERIEKYGWKEIL